MKNLIALLLVTGITITCQSQGDVLASFGTKGFDNSKWICKQVTVENGELVQTILPISDEEDYKTYGDFVEWIIREPGTYIITMRYNENIGRQYHAKERDLFITVPEEGLETRDLYNMKRRSHYLD